MALSLNLALASPTQVPPNPLALLTLSPLDPHPCPAEAPLTKARGEEELPNSVPHRGRQGEAHEGLDVQLVHQAQPRVLLGLQRI